MSEIKVNKISQRSGTAITLGNSGTDFQLPSGADIVAQSGSVITIAAGATITNNGTATGFGPTGAVSWNTTAVTSSPITATSGVGYFIDTSGGAITVNLPVGVAGAIVSLADYTNTWQTNNVTVSANGSEKIGGIAAPATLDTEGQSVTFLYVDATEGWKNIQDSTSNVTGSPFVAATGGTILTCGNYKTHVFTGPGTFTVTNAGAPSGSNSVEYLVVAGGGGTIDSWQAGAGAGGFRQNYPSPAVAGLPVTAQGYPITVGAGGAATTGCVPGNSGNNSIFSTITSTGGGGSGTSSPGISGGSGGGGAIYAPPIAAAGAGGAGNTPPVSPPQGNSGGNGAFTPDGNTYSAGGGGGAGAVGSNGGTGGGPFPGRSAGAGGVGSPIATTIFGPTAPTYGTPGPAPGRYFAGGGGAGGWNTTVNGGGYLGALGGAGGGGAGANSPEAPTPTAGGPGNPGTANTGGGGGGGGATAPVGTSGGSGIVVIRYKFQ
jgi:hypothetical protein